MPFCAFTGTSFKYWLKKFPGKSLRKRGFRFFTACKNSCKSPNVFTRLLQRRSRAWASTKRTLALRSCYLNCGVGAGTGPGTPGEPARRGAGGAGHAQGRRGRRVRRVQGACRACGVCGECGVRVWGACGVCAACGVCMRGGCVQCVWGVCSASAACGVGVQCLWGVQCTRVCSCAVRAVRAQCVVCAVHAVRVQ